LGNIFDAVVVEQRPPPPDGPEVVDYVLERAGTGLAPGRN
jgi:hypothetical protein